MLDEYLKLVAVVAQMNGEEKDMCMGDASIRKTDKVR